MAWKTVWVALAEWPPDHTEDILLCSKRQFALQYKILFTRKWGFSAINMVYIPLQVNKVKLLKCVERVILMIKGFLIRTDTKRCTPVLFVPCGLLPTSDCPKCACSRRINFSRLPPLYIQDRNELLSHPIYISGIPIDNLITGFKENSTADPLSEPWCLLPFQVY